MIRGLVMRALEGAQGAGVLTPRGAPNSVLNSWNSLRTDGGVQVFDSDDEEEKRRMKRRISG